MSNLNLSEIKCVLFFKSLHFVTQCEQEIKCSPWFHGPRGCLMLSYNVLVVIRYMLYLTLFGVTSNENEVQSVDMVDHSSSQMAAENRSVRSMTSSATSDSRCSSS